MSKRRRKTRKEKRSNQRRKDYGRKLQRYEKALLGRGRKAKQLQGRLKNEPLNVISRACRMAEGIREGKRRVDGEAFVGSFRELSHINRMPYSGTMKGELNWATEIILRHADRISRFIEMKRKFETRFISGRYEKAEETLRMVEAKFGVSFWSMEKGFLLSEYRGGLKGNRKFLQAVSEETKGSNSEIIAEFLSRRAERDMSYSNYASQFATFLEMHPKEKRLYGILTNVRFKLDFPKFDRYADLAYVLYYENLFPIIDRYETYIRVMQTLASNMKGDFRSLAGTCVERMREKVRDVRLDILAFFGGDDRKIEGGEAQDELLGIIDMYTKGDYAGAVEKVRDGIVEKCDCFEFYELYGKSVLHLQQEWENPFSEESIGFRVLESVFNVLEKNEKTRESVEFLAKMSYSLGSMRIGNQILAFNRENRFGKHALNHRTFGVLNSSVGTPRVALAIDGIQEALKYLKQLEQKYPDNSGVQLFMNIIEQDKCEGEIELGVEIPEKRRLKYQARALMRRGEWKSSIEKLESLRKIADGSSPFQEDVVTGLFKCYLKAGLLKECLHLIVDIYLDNKNVLASLDIVEILKAQEEGENVCEQDDICWPVLHKMLQEEKMLETSNWGLYTKCDDFLEGREIGKPSDIEKILDKFDIRRLVYFLRYVCVPEVMDFSPFAFENSEDLENERIRICQLLLKLDKASGDHYLEEIRELTRIQMTRKAIQHVEKSRIHIDTGGITRSLDRLFYERVNRCIEYAHLDGDLRLSARWSLIRLEVENKKPLLVLDIGNDEGVKEFVSVFNEVKNRFISSNEYGLDSYLNVRIRHGTLSGQIRSHFENEQLITQKKEGRYARNEHWINVTFSGYGPDVCEKADELLGDFSKKIDDVIERVKDKYIQIKGIGDDEKGLFDYDYSDAQIVGLWMDIFEEKGVDLYDGIVEEVLKELWYRTEVNLEKVREYIKERLRDELTEAIDELAENIYKLKSDLKHSQFSAAIARCKTNIQNELEQIAEWFRIAHKSAFDDFSIQQAIDAAWEMVLKCYQQRKLTLELQKCEEVTCRGGTLESFIDMMFIVLENVARHGGLCESGELKAAVSVELAQGKLNIVVSNRVRPEDLTRIGQHLEKLEKLGGDSTSMKFIRREGGSGYHKLYKIVKHDLKRNEYVVKFAVGSDEMFNARIEMEAEGITA